ncbi:MULTISPECIES: alpha/beta hydrolase [Streptomyces]|uniref:alpha/beta hydrolase n=1 Tax=Streptomyces TaxID=1883 RepID=UPI0004AA98BC|nr:MULTISPECIES: alpha/beta hydrolase [Streptomyces]
MDLVSLRNAKPADLYAAADAYDALCKAYAQHAADWKSGTTDRVHGSGWSGPASAAAIPVLDGITTKLNAAMTELSCIGKELRDYTDSFTLAQGKLKQALADAQAKGFTVGDDGTVSWPPSTNPYQATDWQAKQKAAAEEIGKRIGTALSEATRADEGLASELKRFAGHATDKSGLDEKTASADAYLETWAEGANPLWQRNIPDKDASPTEVNSWWKGLGPEGQQWFLSHHPEVLGNLDGVPADVRDKVNRDRLEALMHSIRDKKPGELNAGEKDLLALYGPIDARLRQHEGEQPPIYLLGLGGEGQGRAVLSYGNPDTATDISAYVPGITTTMDSLGPGENDGTNEAENALNLYRAASRKAPAGHSVASIVWLGYDSPGMDFGAASTKAGKDGAPAYAKFLGGVRASHEGTQPAHITAVGHSYGSYLVGQATKLATQPGSHYAPPDDVVFIGSPGVGADKASDLKMPSGHVWVGAAANDIVTHAPSKFSIDPDERWYGRDPSSKHFGANRFTVDDWSRGNPIDAHTKYLNGRGGPSLDNIAAIVSGSGGVKLTGQRG